MVGRLVQSHRRHRRWRGTRAKYHSHVDRRRQDADPAKARTQNQAPARRGNPPSPPPRSHPRERFPACRRSAAAASPPPAATEPAPQRPPDSRGRSLPQPNPAARLRWHGGRVLRILLFFVYKIESSDDHGKIKNNFNRFKILFCYFILLKNQQKKIFYRNFIAGLKVSPVPRGPPRPPRPHGQRQPRQQRQVLRILFSGLFFCIENIMKILVNVSNFCYKSITFLRKWCFVTMFVSIQTAGQKIEFTDKSIIPKKQF